MQVNELVGQVWQGTRLTDIDQAFKDTRATPATRAEWRGTDESRRPGTRRETTRMPRRYGAGF